MSASVRFRLLLATTIAGVGMVDAGLGADWDLFVVFSMVTGVVASILVQKSERASMSVRADLARWVRQKADVSGEPIDDVLDRVIASAQHGLFPDDDS